MNITPADILAATDVVDQLLNEADSATFAEAQALEPALSALVKKCNDAKAMLHSAAVAAMEGQPVVLDGVVHVPKAEGKWRVDWPKFRARVADAAKVSSEGVVLRTANQKVDRAIELMCSAFVSPATVPKAGALKLLRIDDLADVASWEKTGTKIVTIETGGPE